MTSKQSCRINYIILIFCTITITNSQTIGRTVKPSRRDLLAQINMFAEQTRGICTDKEDGWWEAITTTQMCTEAASQLGWGSPADVSVPHRPPGCFKGSSPYFNTNQLSLETCSLSWKCICSLTCPSGKYQDQSGKLNCKLCSIGQYQDQIKLAGCKMCDAGQYQNQRGGKKRKRRG